MTAPVLAPPDRVQEASRIRWELGLLLILISIQLLPLLFFDFFPTEDGPAHVATAAVVADLGRSPTLSSYYSIDLFPTPNVAGLALLVPLASVGDPWLGDMLLVAVCLIALPLAAWYALGGISRSARYLSLLTVPIASGWFLHMGFYNFCLGMAGFFLTIGYWVRHRSSPGTRNTFRLGGLLLATYLSHGLAFLATLLVIGVVELWYSTLSRDHPVTNSGAVGTFWSSARWIVAASAPSLVLFAAWSVTAQGGIGGSPNITRSVQDLFTGARSIVSLANAESDVAALIAYTILAVVIVGVWTTNRARIWRSAPTGFLLASAALLFMYFIGPTTVANGTDIGPRLGVFAVLVALLWLAYLPLPSVVRPAIAVAATVAVVALLLMRWPIYADLNRDMTEYMTAREVVLEDRTVVPVFLIDPESGAGGTAAPARTRPLLDAAGYLTPELGVVNLAHYQGGFSYFPAQFRGPNLPVSSLETSPDKVDGTADYVLVWGARYAAPEDLGEPETAAMLAELKRNYRLIFTSDDRQLLDVYERR